MARIAKSLDVLRSQVNALSPNRDKSSDGWIGDPRHQATKSEHNADPSGVVRALDITHDPKNGVDTYKISESLRLSRDPRILYVISNGRIFSSEIMPFVWRPYRGSNPHDHHNHTSVVATPNQYDNPRPWDLDAKGVTVNGRRHERIVATIFGGPGDEQDSAYGGRINPTLPGVSLPSRFLSPRPQVRVIRDNKSVVCNIVDVGPWNTNDPYWTVAGRRPQAETGKDTRGRKTNKAGIDLTPAAAKAIGVTGLNFVDWEFV